MKRMILVDGNSLMYRAYFGMVNTKSMTNSKGIYTNATYAFARMINSLCSTEYDAILVAFDAGKKTFRHTIMDDYKAGRAPMPDEMRMQISYIKTFLDLKRIKRYEMPLYEADDIIGTMANMATREGYHVDVYSSDKDLLQLVNDNVTVHMTKKGITELEDYTPSTFYAKYEIPVSSFVDLKALMGDKSDNIPGVPGIGEVKAIKYLKLYPHIEDILANLEKIKGSDHDKFLNNGDLALLCKKMATIKIDSPLEITLNDTLKKEEDTEELIKFYEELEFRSFLKEVKIPTKNTAYKIATKADLKDILLPGSTILVETADYNYHKNAILALGLSNKLGNFIIEQHLFKENEFIIFMQEINKTCYDLKRIYVAFKHFNIEVAKVDFDLYLATYILNSKITKHEFKTTIYYYGPNKINTEEEIYGKGAKRKIPELDVLYSYIASKTEIVNKLIGTAKTKLIEQNEYELLDNIEIPLSYVLGEMEYYGIKIDTKELDTRDKDLTERISKIENEIYQLANTKFNISSPKQLAQVLFVDLAIPYPENSKKGYSTEVSILNKISMLHPIVNKVLEYRQLTKLYSTYVNGLRDSIYKDGKVHTIFEQALTETGRLSSIEPNLQNIPIRTEEGRLIRKLFIPSNEDYVLYSADYSQIELRVLASLANVEHFKLAFKNDEDIHSATAKKIFGHDDVSSLERRKAKAVNFGIVYGISAYGLSNDIDISQKEAKEFIAKYYELNPEIKIYMENIIKECEENGFVKTIFNRRRYIPEIKSKNYLEREFGKRMAMNAPIQGSAADIIKKAMIDIDLAIKEQKINARMLVQVHDELVFEVREDEVTKLQNLVREKMINAVKLDVKLDVSDGIGKNWYELK